MKKIIGLLSFCLMCSGVCHSQTSEFFTFETFSGIIRTVSFKRNMTSLLNSYLDENEIRNSKARLAISTNDPNILTVYVNGKDIGLISNDKTLVVEFDEGEIEVELYRENTFIVRHVHTLKGGESSNLIFPIIEISNIAEDIVYDGIHDPIDNLFNSWTSLDLDKYMIQYSRDVIQYSKNFSPRGYNRILQQRASLFKRLSSVDVLNYEITEVKPVDEFIYQIYLNYSIIFRFKDGRVIREIDIDEKYVVEYSRYSESWKIVENYDYIK